jgi:hypothetical protein
VVWVLISAMKSSLDEATVIIALTLLLAGLTAGTIVPAAMDLIKGRQGRRIRRLALCGIWIAGVYAPILALNWTWTLWRHDLSYYFPNDAVHALAILAFWIVFTVGYAMAVHALLARTGNLPQIS